MKGKMILLVLVAGSLVMTNVSACSGLEAKLSYQLSEDGTYYSVVDCDSFFESDVVIPSTYKNLPVKTIGECAFSWCDTLTGITIPDSVTTIAESAFAFCCNLTGVAIGDKVTKIEDFAFEGCAQLTSITVDAANECYTSIDGNLYSKNEEVLMQYATGKTNVEFTVPDSVVTIGASAFGWCESLKNITIGSNVALIGEAAFYWCDGLTSVTVPDCVTEIGESAFSWCENLESLVIGANVVKIGKEMVTNSEKLKSITFQDAENWYCTSNSTYMGGQPTDLHNPTQNAADFLGEKGNYYWYKE